MTLTYKRDLDSVKVNHYGKYTSKANLF